MLKKPAFLLIWLLLLKGLSYGFPLLETDAVGLSLDFYLRNDLVSFKNVIDLDSHNRDDHTTYFGIDYSFGFKLELKESSQQYYIKLERNGPYDYDAPLFIHNTLMVSGPSHISPYRNEELLPELEEFWFDLPLARSPFRFKAGLFPYEVGKGYVIGCGSYENYGFSFYRPGERLSWRFHYFRPDLVYKVRRGPRISQEIDEGILYEPNAANYFSFDALLASGESRFQPFVGLLLDRTSAGKRTNLFAAPVHKETLGTVGLDYDIKFKDLSLGFEAARNFGMAESEDPAFKDIRHKGYLFYANAYYYIGRFSPHCQLLFSSGNKVTADMVENGDVDFPGSSNRAFSTFSPLNINLSDAHSPCVDSAPLVFLGWGYGLSYGLGPERPSTHGDDAVLDNLIMPSAGFDYEFTDKFSVTIDYWYMRANERGIGMLGGSAKELSRDLGHEIDASFYYDITEDINLSLCTGYFFPGGYFKEERDDTDGSLFAPFVRGDGNANGAYQIEFSIEFNF